MKKKIAFISMSLIVTGLLYFTGISDTKAYYYGPLPGHTGSPFDGLTCAVNGCHNSHPLQSPQPWITSNVPVAGYTQNTVYTITAKAVKIGDGSFGFQISPQTTGGSPMGTMIVTNSTTTQITTNAGLQYMEQTAYGYQGTDSLVWTFQWKAPVAGTGPVTFYGAFNCGNGNSVATGSYVFPATLVIPEISGDGIDNIDNAQTDFSVFPNPAKENVNITYTIKEARTVEITIYAIDGRKVSTLFNGMENEGGYLHRLSLPAAITPGIYLLQLKTNDQSTIRRIVIE